MSAWVRTYLLIIRNADKAAANTKYLNIDPDTGGDRTFNFMQCATAAAGPGGATVAWACITRATLAMVTKFGEHVQDLIDAGKLAVYRLDNGDWTITTALADTTKKVAALVFKTSIVGPS